MTSEKTPEYMKSSQTLDLERRQENGNRSDKILSTSDQAEKPEPLDEGNYLNVDPMYQNYADPTQEPMLAEGGPEKKLEDKLRPDDSGSESEVKADSSGSDAVTTKKSQRAEVNSNK